MRISRHGQQGELTKSPYNFEEFQSDIERKMMLKLEADTHVTKWTKRHGITIPWLDSQKHMRRYFPDFLVEYEDGAIKLIEAKDKSRADTDEVKKKRKAAELWCKRRNMEYIVMLL